jgi:adenylyl cyclase-associated protein
MLQKPMADKMVEIENFREKGRRCDYFNHLSAISESIPALGWINMAPTPAPFVKEMCDASMFYTNRVLKDWKDKSKAHVEWTKAWIQTLTQLQGFVKQHHTTGLVWNPKGVEAKSVVNHGVPPAPAGPAAGGPPPPPPIPKNLFDDIKVAENKEDKARNALFDELNKGDGVTSGLKKVTADMQTHKNPDLRGTSVVPAGAIKSSSPKPGAFKAATPPKKEPKFELEGKKWAVEYHVKNPNLVIEETETNQSVYVYRCEGSTLKVEGKVNNIVVDGCKKCAVVFTDAVSSCEFINCQSVQMQVLGKVPTISIDKTDGCQMFLSKDSVGVEIITAKSSEMNVMIPNGEDFVEQPVAEQFKTVINGIKLTTSVMEST